MERWITQRPQFIDSSPSAWNRYGTSKEQTEVLPFRQGYDGGILGASPHLNFILLENRRSTSLPEIIATHRAGSQRNEGIDVTFRIEEAMRTRRLI